MYFEPKYFKSEEIFPTKVIENHRFKNGSISNSVWRLMDGRVLWTLDKFRERFGTTICNDYLWGGRNQYRGFRPVIELIGENLEPFFSSFTSQHCFGRAIDCKFKNVSAEEVRQDVRKNQNAEAYQYITAVEEDVSWLHFDTRNWDKENKGILFFKP